MTKMEEERPSVWCGNAAWRMANVSIQGKKSTTDKIRQGGMSVR